MKSTNPSVRTVSSSILGALAVGTCLLTFTPDRALASLTYDIRAISVDSPLAAVLDPKHVEGLTPGTKVTFEIWVRIMTSTGIGVFGYQNSAFSVLSSNGGSILGNVGLFQPIAPWNSSSSPGTITASLDGDSDFDNGTNSTTSSNGVPKARSDNTAAGGGDPAFANAQTTNTHVPAVNFQPVAVGAESGYEFEIGIVTFIMTNYGLTDPSVPIGINVRPASDVLTSPAIKSASAIFIEESTTKSGTTGVIIAGEPVSLSTAIVPEPSAFGMVLLGAMGVVGLRRFGIRRP